MYMHTWFRHLFTRTTTNMGRKLAQSGRQRSWSVICAEVQELEPRKLLTTIVVNSNLDDSAITHMTLRDAINQANAGDSIHFAAGLVGDTIKLTQGVLNITRSITITGPGADHLTISGNNSFELFSVHADSGSAEPVVTITGLTLAHGASQVGGAISNAGMLSIANDVISRNSARGLNSAGLGGAIYNQGTLSSTNDTISGNSAMGTADSAEGGGIFNQGTCTSTNDTISGNSASGNSRPDGTSGGGIFNDGTLTLTNDTLSGNSATDGGAIWNHSIFRSSNNTLADNSATFGGADYERSEISFISTNDTFAGNSATAQGGAVYGVAAFMQMANDTITGNRAVAGGGIYMGSASNSAWMGSNTIVAGNTTPTAAPSELSYDSTGSPGSPFSAQNSLIGDMASATLAGIVNGVDGNIAGVAASSIFVTQGGRPDLTDNGGPTQTVALAPNSPAIGQGGAMGYVTNAKGAVLTVDNSTFISVGDWLKIGSDIVLVSAVNDKSSTVTISAPAIPILANASIMLAYDQRGSRYPRMTNDMGAVENVSTGMSSSVFNSILTIDDSNSGLASKISIYDDPADQSIHVMNKTGSITSDQAFPASYLRQIVVNPDSNPDSITLDASTNAFPALVNGIVLNSGPGSDVAYDYVFKTGNSNSIGNVTVNDKNMSSTSVSRLDFSNSTKPVAVNLGVTTPQNVYGDNSLKLSLQNTTANQTVVGGTKANTLTAAPSGTDILIGGIGGNTVFAFVDPTGTRTDTVVPAGATNRLDFTGLKSTALAVNLNNAIVAHAGKLTIDVDSPLRALTNSPDPFFQEVKGGHAENTLTSGKTTVTLDASLGTTNTLIGGAGDTLDGGDGNDRIYVNTNGTPDKFGNPAIVTGYGSGTNTIVNTGNGIVKGGIGGDLVEITGTLAGSLTVTMGILVDSTGKNPDTGSPAETVWIDNARIGGTLSINGSTRDSRTNDDILISESLIVGNVFANLAGGDDLYSQQLCTVDGTCKINAGGGADNEVFISGMYFTDPKNPSPAPESSQNLIMGALTINGGTGNGTVILDHLSVMKATTLAGGSGKGSNTVGISPMSQLKGGYSASNFQIRHIS